MKANESKRIYIILPHTVKHSKMKRLRKLQRSIVFPCRSSAYGMIFNLVWLFFPKTANPEHMKSQSGGLEVFSSAASKYNAVRFLREYGKYEHIIGFGDNLNDIPLFRACDECYTVENAKDELKEIATAVIESNDNDGVAKWLEENAK